MRYCFLWLGILFLVLPNAQAQQDSRSYSQASLVDVIKDIEQHSNYIFNYSPEQLANYRFSGQLAIQEASVFTPQLLYHTPFEYEHSGTSIIVYLPEARTIRFCGTLKDASDQSPLPLANIYLDQGETGTHADENGFFDFSFQAYKNQEITLSYIGYESQKVQVQELAANECSDFFLVLDEQLFKGEIVVTDYILDGISEGGAYSEVLFDYSSLPSTPANVEQDILKAIQFPLEHPLGFHCIA